MTPTRALAADMGQNSKAVRDPARIGTVSARITGEDVAAKDTAHASHGIRLTRRRRGKRVVERRDGDEGMMGGVSE